jgi:hypothetical protein
MADDMISQQMHPADRALMYRASNAAIEAIVATGAPKDIRIMTLACLRALSVIMSKHAWSRDPQTVRMISELLPLYINAEIQDRPAGDSGLIVKPYNFR